MRTVDEISAEAEKLAQNPARVLGRPHLVLDLVQDTLSHVRALRDEVETLKLGREPEWPDDPSER